MSTHRHLAREAAATGAAVLLLSLPLMGTAAMADEASTPNKAQVERAERAANQPVDPPLSQGKLQQLERHLTADTPKPAPKHGTGTSYTTTVPASSDNDAAAWQIALSAALGAVATAGAFVAARQMNHHRAAIAH